MERTHDEEIHKRINHLLRKRTCVKIESSEYLRKTMGFFTNSWRNIALESFFEEHAPPKPTATILEAIREQLKKRMTS